ncbi:MAG TPA: hypothetical protein VH092_18770 [Urbifossiella sp.]|nr:hypothetical protein [Urbifossiella sp.]
MLHSEPTDIEQTAHQPPAIRRVRYEVCLSLLITTIRWQSAPRDTDCAWERLKWGFLYATASLLLGPWGVPWGPVWTAVAVWTNLTGGVEDG